MFKYFLNCPKSGIVEAQNETVTKIRRDGVGINSFVIGTFEIKNPIIKSTKYGFEGLCPCGEWHSARKVDYNPLGSKHKCDKRCETAKSYKCECSCGGKYHGKAS